MYNDLYGIVNALLLALGAIKTPQAWTADPGLALAAVIMVDVSKTTPFMTLLILAALQMLPRDLYEAARVDGVHPLWVFWGVTRPLIWPALMVAIAFRTLDALRVFDLIYVLTANSRETMSMSIYARQYLLEFQDVGIGSAASLLFTVIALVVTMMATIGRGDRQSVDPTAYRARSYVAAFRGRRRAERGGRQRHTDCPWQADRSAGRGGAH
jgi:trehalose/maltose transport system permease protein